MNAVEKKVLYDELVVYEKNIYKTGTIEKSKKYFEIMQNKKIVEGEWNDEKWMGYSDVKKFGISFVYDTKEYALHAKKILKYESGELNHILRCYAVYCLGKYILPTIRQNKIKSVIRFIENFSKKNYRIKVDELVNIDEFLMYLGFKDEEIESIEKQIIIDGKERTGARKLKPVINYLVVGEEINSVIDNIDDEKFVELFPIYLWVNLTFVLPLRATEMLLIPWDCLKKENDIYYLQIRRTKLKKGKRIVHYDVEKDYKIFNYRIPDGKMINNIQKYMELTKEQERRFLFAYEDYMSNEMLSLAAFNKRVADFVRKFVIGNPKYDFAKYACGIDEFEPITAGDSRPIAIANLYFQNTSQDICMSLADHEHIDTNAGYYTNVDQIIMASSVMKYTKMLNEQDKSWEDDFHESRKRVLKEINSTCTYEGDRKSLRTECIKEGHLENCIGCRHYMPSKSEIDGYMENWKKKANNSSVRMINMLNKMLETEGRAEDVEKIILEAQTACAKYRTGCEVSVKEKIEGWEKNKNFQKRSF